MAQSTAVYLGRDSNLGPCEAMLAPGNEGLRARGIREVLSGTLCLTEPVGGPPQDWFVNQVVAGETFLSPDRLLELCRALEEAAGRVCGVEDLRGRSTSTSSFYGEVVRDSPELQVPRLHERRSPLAEITPALLHPRLGLVGSELFARCEDRSQVLLHWTPGALA